VEKQNDFSIQKCIDSQPEKSLSRDGWCHAKHRDHRVTELHHRQTEWLFLYFASGHLIGVKNSVNFVGTLTGFRCGKESFGFKKLLERVWTLVYVFHRSMR